MFLGMMTLVSTRGTQSSTGAGPLPPPPLNSTWVGMTTVSSGTSRPSLVRGIISGWASVTCPGKICTPSIRTAR